MKRRPPLAESPPGCILDAVTAQAFPDRDSMLRLAAFAALRCIPSFEPGQITRDQMTTGFEFEGERIAFALRARGIWKPRQADVALSVTTAAAKQNVTSRYDDEIGGDGWFHYRYQGTDPIAADNVAVRRAFEFRKPLIYFWGQAQGLYDAIWPVYVIGDDPSNLTFQLAADTVGLGEPTLVQGGGAEPAKRYATVAVKRRLHQHRFRELVVTAYKKSCTVCHLRHSVLLDAAHILEDRDQRGLPEVPNGLSLCKIHHGAYDADILGVDPDYRIHIRHDVLEEVDGPMLRHGLQEMHGIRIQVPSREDLKPRREFLEERFARFRAA